MTHCVRCGTCCKKGGPTLHHEDMEILRHHHARFAHLITIREGELTYNPVQKMVEPAIREMVKVAGKGGVWSCFYFREEDASCAIYEHRFLECRLLKCWKPAEIISIIGKNTIRRSDVINRDDPILRIIEMQEKECSLRNLKRLIDEATSAKGRREALRELTDLVRSDASLRSYALEEFGLRPEYEFFILGRPVQDIIRDAGLTIKRAEARIA